MKSRPVKYVVSILLLVVVAYNSVYFKKLDEVKAASTSKQFAPAAYAGTFFTTRLVPNLDKAIDITKLLNLIQTAPATAFKGYSHALGIGNIRYFLVKGEGTIKSIDENTVTIMINNDSTKKEVKIATEFVYGNAIRDASGLINLNEFSSTMDFNNVSAEINKIVRTNVLPPFKARAKPGEKVQFSGAIELNQAHTNLDNIEVILIRLQVVS